MYPVESSFGINPKDLPRIQEVVKATGCRFVGQVTKHSTYITVGGEGAQVQAFTDRWQRLNTGIRERTRNRSWLARMFNHLRVWF